MRELHRQDACLSELMSPPRGVLGHTSAKPPRHDLDDELLALARASLDDWLRLHRGTVDAAGDVPPRVTGSRSIGDRHLSRATWPS